MNPPLPLPKELLFDYTQPDLYHQHWCGNCASYNIHGGSCDPCTSPMFSKKSPALPTEVKKRLILTHLSSPLPTEPPHRVYQHEVPTLCGMRAAVPQTESHWGAWRWQLRLMGSHCHLLGAWPNNATCQGQKGSPGTAVTPATDWSLFYL